MQKGQNFLFSCSGIICLFCRPDRLVNEDRSLRLLNIYKKNDKKYLGFTHPEVVLSEVFFNCPSWLIESGQQNLAEISDEKLSQLRRFDEELVNCSRQLRQWKVGLPVPSEYLALYKVDGPYYVLENSGLQLFQRTELGLLLTAARENTDPIVPIVYAYADKMSWSAAMALKELGLKEVAWTSYERLHSYH